MTLPSPIKVPGLSGLRFVVQYSILGNAEDARNIAENICNEQTVEFPASALPKGDIPDQVMGKIESFEQLDEAHYEVEISFAVETAGNNILQLLNNILGLSGLLDGITVKALKLPVELLEDYHGPRFGITGLRNRIGIHDRPLLATALKPMGLSSQHLADLAYEFAVNGLDIIKDDHGITDLKFSPFEERVTLCSKAVARANRDTGLNCLYIANVTAPAEVAFARARFAKEVGAGGLMVSAALTGFDLMQRLADSNDLGLPILYHPSFSGGLLAGSRKSGFSHYVAFGQLPRLAGADVSIFVNYGGRFPVTQEDSHAAVQGCLDEMGSLKPAFPCIGGGMTLDRIPDLCAEYGKDSVLLVGGGLHTMSADLGKNVRDFLKAVEG